MFQIENLNPANQPSLSSAHSVLTGLGCLLLTLTVQPVQAKNPNDASFCPAILNQTVARLQDEKPQNLCQYSGQVVVVVNTASFCGFTPQYKGLEALYDKYKSRGLIVLGFPSNDFSQEPEDNKKIADFCENTFGVKFPMFTKTSVRGSDASPLFKNLTQRTQTSPKWNFYKYVISRDGVSIKSFSSMTAPDDKSFVAEIEKQLQTKTP
ncbi:MAG: glutathione peroxidase [Limnohabitans sp.]|nr:glutathione peroxidase [Limnohabitans sp.]